jgi:branched-chain amino acid transport system permease protein
MLSLLDRRALFVLVLLLFFAALPAIAVVAGQEFYIGQFRRILIFAIAAISLDLILGYGGMVSLGHAAFFGIGAYVVAILNWHAQQETALLGLIPGSRNILVTWPAAVLVAAAVALVVGSISLRTSGIYFIMITLAFAQMIYFLFVSLEAYGGDDGLRFPGDIGFIDAATNALADAGWDAAIAFDTIFYYVTFVLFLAVLYGSFRLVNSRFGMVIQGCRENERRMRAIGFATFRYKLVCFTIAGGIAGLAGAVFAAHESYIVDHALDALGRSHHHDRARRHGHAGRPGRGSDPVPAAREVPARLHPALADRVRPDPDPRRPVRQARHLRLAAAGCGAPWTLIRCSRPGASSNASAASSPPTISTSPSSPARSMR